MLAEGGQEASRSPSLAVSTLAELLPEAGDRRQSQRGEHQRQLGGIGFGHNKVSWVMGSVPQEERQPGVDRHRRRGLAQRC